MRDQGDAAVIVQAGTDEVLDHGGRMKRDGASSALLQIEPTQHWRLLDGASGKKVDQEPTVRTLVDVDATNQASPLLLSNC